MVEMVPSAEIRRDRRTSSASRPRGCREMKSGCHRHERRRSETYCFLPRKCQSVVSHRSQPRYATWSARAIARTRRTLIRLLRGQCAQLRIASVVSGITSGLRTDPRRNVTGRERRRPRRSQRAAASPTDPEASAWRQGRLQRPSPWSGDLGAECPADLRCDPTMFPTTRSPAP